MLDTGIAYFEPPTERFQRLGGPRKRKFEAAAPRKKFALKDNCEVFEGDTNRLALTSKQPWYQDAHAALDRPLGAEPFFSSPAPIRHNAERSDVSSLCQCAIHQPKVFHP